jgi:hypothetical protein
MVTAPPPVAEEPKASRKGRPKGSKNKKVDEAKPEGPDLTVTIVKQNDNVPDAVARDVAANVADAIASSNKDIVSEDGGKSLDVYLKGELDGVFHLYVDCMPDGGDFVSYADVLMAKANAKIVAGGQVAHYKFLKFGEAAGALAIALGEVLDEEKPMAVFCNATSEALPILTARATVITRSVR